MKPWKQETKQKCKEMDRSKNATTGRNQLFESSKHNNRKTPACATAR